MQFQYLLTLNPVDIKRRADSAGRFLYSPYTFLAVFLTVILSYYYVDMPVALWMKAHKLASIKTVAKSVSQLGLGVYYFILPIIGILIGKFFHYPQLKRYSGLMLWVVIASSLLIEVFKILLGRARPHLLFSDNVYGFYCFKFNAKYWSFPSGHSGTIAAVMTLLSLLYPKLKYLALSVCIAVFLSRLTLTAHFPADILAGAYLGALSAVWVTRFYFSTP